ncbi:MAG TPA: YceI family protein [Symbiobacteriaceae bacterium]|nr:YceI family protein [Symbiobacteriaceae bacterium]
MATWVIDSSHSEVGFAVRHMMIATVKGRFNKVEGTLQFDPANLAAATFEGKIEVASIDTRDAQRDGHLRTGDFFDAENHPYITFTNTKVTEVDGNEFKLVGDLTIRGVTKTITLAGEFAGTNVDPWGNTKAGFTATAKVNRKDFGVNWNAILEAGGVMVSDEVKLTLELEFNKQA